MILLKTKFVVRHVIEQVAAGHVLQNDEVVFAVLKQIDEADDVRVLADLEDLYLTTLLEDFHIVHVLFFYLLYRDLLACFIVCRKLDNAKLTLT